MTNADGSVIIKVAVDASQADKKLADLRDKAEETEREIMDLSTSKEEAKKKSVFSAAELDAEKKTLAEMKQQLEEIRAVAKDKTLSVSAREEARANIPEQREAITEQQERVRLLQAEYNKIETSIERYDDKIRKATQKLNKQKNDAGALAKRLASASKFSVKMSEAHEKAEKSMRKFNLRLREVVRSALVFTLITKALAELRKWLGNVLKTNDKTRESIARLKGALLTLAQPLVNVVIPAATVLLDALTKIVLVLADLFSRLSGSTLEQSKEAAEALNKETAALEGVGEAAKDAAAGLASFDEINQLGDKDNGTSYIDPDFSSLESAKLPEWLTSFTATLSDIVFKWENLTVQDILEKVVASLGAIAGTIIGFSVGGFGGAAIGMVVGSSISSIISDFTFGENGALNAEDILSSLCVALNTAAGTVIGFSVGGAKGAAVGAVVGASVSAGIKALFFDGNGSLDGEEVIKTLVGALTSVVGAVLGFKVGGVKGTAIGVAVATGVTSLVSGILFNNDGKVGREEVLSSLCSAAFALLGGVVGFSVGGPKGAAIGATIGAGISVLLGSLLFDNDGVLSKEEIAKSATAALGSLAGGIIGFSVGGPGGAFIGATIGAAATIILSGLVFDENGKLDTKELLTSLCAAAGTIVGAAIGFAVGGPLGAAIGLTVGAVLTITITDVLFKGFNDLKENVPNFTGIGPDYSWMFGAKNVSLPNSSVVQGSQIPKNTSFTQDYSSLMEKFLPTGGFGSVAGNASGGQQESTVNVKLYLDGREIAKNQVKHINNMSVAAGHSVILT